MYLGLTRNKNIANIVLLIGGMLLISQSSLNSQTSQAVSSAKQYLMKHSEHWNLSEGDLDEMRLTDAYRSDHNGVQHLYFIQQYQGIDIHQAIASVAMDPNGRVVHLSQDFIPNIREKIRSSKASLSAREAVQIAFEDRGFTPPVLTRSNVTDGRIIEFEKTPGLLEAARAQKVYFPDRQGNLKLHWDVSYFAKGASDYWSLRIDAGTGQVSDVDSWTEHCSFPVHTDDECLKASNERFIHQETPFTNNGISSTYNVYPPPVESPIHGNRQMAQGPVDEEASPYGWHDTNGDETPDYTILRGNNVNAMVDRNGDYFRDTFYDADGGSELIFDFPFDQDLEPRENAAADATNLFYMNNFMHDFSWAYGFDEAAGNFQATNYSGEGGDNDYVNALSQFDALSGSSLNNANFSTPSDGNGNGTMRMFVWTDGSGGSLYLMIASPDTIAGGYEAQPANFGDTLTSQPIEGNIVFVEDGSPPYTDACQEIENGSALAGNIALIDRGGCEFGAKILRAEQEGAAAAIVINNQPTGLVTMAPGQVGNQVTIPSVFITLEDGQIIRQFAEEGITGSLKRPEVDEVARLSSGFDNGVIAHEYGHGISNRLTGGPSQAGCLGNPEQMGEGWSDYFTLVTSAREGDNGTMPKGIGNYVVRQEPDGKGIRTFPYSTDMNVNPVTYYNIFDGISTAPTRETSPYAGGHVWASTLWDLYWALVDRYGFDPDLVNGSGGNNIAVQLVMDGMKLQPCSPGMIDGRDAILAADQINNGGANQCLIWEVFTRRGMGYGADQGSALSIQDGEESYDILPTCIEELKISKSVTPEIDPGDIIEVRLEVTNHKTSGVTGVLVSDLIPDGCTYVAGSANITPELEENILTFDIGNMDTLDQVTITYEMESSDQKASDELFHDDFETDVYDRWYAGVVTGASNNFEVSDSDPYSGSQSWFVPNTEDANDVFFSNFFPITVSGEKPILRFYHKYDTETGFDGGIVEYSTDGILWKDLGDEMFREGYDGPIRYTTFAQIDQNAFWGESDDWRATYIDLSDLIGQDIYLRFRFGEVEGVARNGWNVDNLGAYDMLNYQTEACVTSDQGDDACDAAEGRGTFVEYREGTSTDDPQREDAWTVFPNPAESHIYIGYDGKSVRDVTVQIRDIRGELVFDKFFSSMQPGSNYQIRLDGLSSGLYLVEWKTLDEWYSKKVIKH